MDRETLLSKCTSDRWIATKNAELTVIAYYTPTCAKPKVDFKEVARETEPANDISTIINQFTTTLARTPKKIETTYRLTKTRSVLTITAKLSEDPDPNEADPNCTLSGKTQIRTGP